MGAASLNGDEQCGVETAVTGARYNQGNLLVKGWIWT